MAQVTRLGTHGVSARLYGSFVGKTVTTTIWASLGDVFLYSAAEYAGITFFYEAYYRATSGVVLTRLFDVTTSNGVSPTETNTTSTSFVRYRSGAVTLTDTHLYRAQFGKSGFDAGEAAGAKLVALEN